MKIAIIGAVDSVEKVYETLSREDTETKFIKYAEDEIEKLPDMVRNIDRDIDGIFLTGIGVYTQLSTNVNLDKPVVYTERGTIGIIKSLWDFNMEGKDASSLRVALDIVKEKDFSEVLNEFNIHFKSYEIQRYNPNKNERDYIKYYLEKYENNEIDCIFTCFGYIYRYFKELNFPVYRIQTTNLDITQKYNELKDRIKFKTLKGRSVQVLVIDVVDATDKFYNSRAMKLNLEEELLTYSKEIEGIMLYSDSGYYYIISNEGVLLSKANIRFLYEMIAKNKSSDVVLGVGIGEGETIYQSEVNAKNALRKSALEKEGNIYFYNGESVVGPLMKQEEIAYKNTPDKDIFKIADKIGISPQYVVKINSVINKLGRDEFTSRELAEIFSISERSVNRILKKIIDSGYGIETEPEPSLGAGRPRRRTKINFTEYWQNKY